MNILIGIPSPIVVNPTFALDNLPALIAYSKSHRPSDNFLIMHKQGVMTAKNRNWIVKAALEKGDIDYIVWLDTDMLYPHDMIVKYLEAEKDIIGCLYFKRGDDHGPIGYYKGTNPLKPYSPLDYRVLPKDEVIEVDGLGFGGMMVSMKVYDRLGDDKWHCYDKNFHLPFEVEDSLTHDLLFCKKAQEHGIKIHLHTGVKPGHIGETVFTENDWKAPEIQRQKDSVLIMIPSIDDDKAIQASTQLTKLAGYPCESVILPDYKREGYMALVNRTVKKYEYDYYVYAACDAFAGGDWLKIAMEAMQREQGELFAFNTGRWHGRLAQFGMAKRTFLQEIYGGDLFYPGYKAHYGDVELTLIAQQRGTLVYDPDSVLVEVDYDKAEKAVNKKDKALFARRKAKGFDGRVHNKMILEQFS